MSVEIRALEQFFAAINRNDMQAITKHFDPQIVRIEPEGFPMAGTYRGITEVQEHVTKGRGTLSCCRFGGHPVKVESEFGGGSWVQGESSAGSSSLRR